MDKTYPECIMCLNDIENCLFVNLPIKKATCTCKAVIHKKCLTQWYNHKKEKVCPVCLSNIKQISLFQNIQSYLFSLFFETIIGRLFTTLLLIIIFGVIAFQIMIFFHSIVHNKLHI
jgi:E3 ubiquitin-protein ligase DOA10